ncbi:MAG: YgeY family selenium metabolism-linked hydrolase [Chloroflexi bacterium]|nr:MAG: YgeY family selenium metabolism-linked hydrolase [Chloroflexota bacterium]
MNQWHLTSPERESLLAFLRKLVQTPSLSGEEGAVAVLVMEEMRRLGFTEVRMDEAGNVVGALGAAEGPVLLLDSHLDTVGVPDLSRWTVAPWGAELRGDTLYGVGSCDMKGGLAATLYGAAHLLRLGIPLRGRLVVAAVGLEEPAEGTGTRILFEEDGLKADWVVIAEPSNLQVVRGQRGHIEMSLALQGRSAHSATPELGENAIYAAARVIFGLEILAEQLAVDPFLGPGALAVTDIRSQAVSRNAVPERCEIIIDRRLTVGETETLALAEVQRVIAREGIRAQLRVIEEDMHTYTGKTCRIRRISPPWAFDEHHPLIAAMLQSAREAGLRPALDKWYFATEGAYTAGVAQIPTVGFGPGDPALAHTCDEHVNLEQVYAAAAAYAALAAHLLRK